MVEAVPDGGGRGQEGGLLGAVPLSGLDQDWQLRQALADPMAATGWSSTSDGGSSVSGGGDYSGGGRRRWRRR